MRLQKLHLSRYGRFTSTSLDFGDAPKPRDIHIVYGPNEAGKSTLFSAWLDLLYGIPHKTPYDFLHNGPMMEIGAEISHAGGALNLLRRKGRGNTLYDSLGNSLPDSALTQPLGGLSRDAYSAMFSLDDETIEKGGDEILASGGELGQLLFSASSGLAGLAAQIESREAALDGFFRKGKRSGGLWEAKSRLKELNEQAKALETSAAEQKRRKQALEVAKAAWAAEKSRETALRKDLQLLEKQLSALPLRRLLTEAEAELAKLGPLPPADQNDLAQLTKLNQEATQLGERAAGLRRQIERIKADLATLPLEDQLLALEEEINQTEALRSGYDGALTDLPKRQIKLGEIAHEIANLLSSLGKSGDEPEKWLLGAGLLPQLRSLLTARSGLQNAHDTALREATKAKTTLADESQRLGPAAIANEAGEEEALTLLLAQITQEDPSHALERAKRDRSESLQKAQESLAPLAPWRGDFAALKALDVPPEWQLAAWSERLQAARLRQAEAHRSFAAAKSQHEKLSADLADADSAPLGFSLSELAASRSMREALWAAHLSDLTAQSAKAFEAALREDDQLAALMGEALARQRLAHEARAEIAALAKEIILLQCEFEAAINAFAAIEDEVSTACDLLGLKGADLNTLQDWLIKRQEALRLIALYEADEAALLLAREAMQNRALSLARALGQSENDPDFTLMLAQAQSRQRSTDKHREAAAFLARLNREAQERAREADLAQEAWQNWFNSWQVACNQTLLQDYDAQSPRIGTLLDLLDALEGKCRERDELNHRITAMEHNREAFLSAKARLFTKLSLPETLAWSDLLKRREAALLSQREQTSLSETLKNLHHDSKEVEAAQAENSSALAALAAKLGWTPERGETLALRLENCLRAERLRHELAKLKDSLAALPQAPSEEDSEELQSRAEALALEVDLARQKVEHLQGDMADARHLLDQIGGDDALAQNASERENLRLALQEQAKEHLSHRFGLIALDFALRRYRESHQSAMLARASAAFEALSLANYPKLSVISQGNSDRLVALNREGASRMAADMSKGTRFQLYLALRIAGYHEIAKSRASVPFIADDIMETFDDARAAATFEVLGEMSEQGQVIYLTHHRHLCQIAKEVCPEANLIELDQL